MKKQIQQLELFHGIAPTTMENILAVGKVITFPKGKHLMRMREPVAAVYVQLTGKSIVYTLTGSGKRKILFVFGGGTLLNEHIISDHTSTVYCETIEESQILVLPVAEFIKVMMGDFELIRNIGMAQEKKIWRLSHQLKNTTSSISMERRLVAKLWKLSKDFGIQREEGIEIDLNLSITFMAEMLGAPRETVSRICSTLVESGLIKMNKKRVTILDPDRIANFYKGEQERLIDIIYEYNRLQ